MKKAILNIPIVFILFLACLTGYSQDWAPLGAEWYYNFTETGGGGPVMVGYCRMIVETDTMIEDKQCSVLSRHIFHANGNDEIQSPPLITYEENNIVYYFQNGQFYILYDFSADLGDSWISRNPYEFYNWPILTGEDTLSVYTVDSINLVNINGSDLKQMWLSSSTDWYFAGHVTERIGSLHFMLPGIWGVWDPPVYGSLRCYFDNDFSYSPNLPCDTLIMSIENEVISRDKLKVYPNPAKDYVIFGIPFTNHHNRMNKGKVIIFNFFGQEVARKEITSEITLVDLRQWREGIYFYRIEMEGQNYSGKFIVQR